MRNDSRVRALMRYRNAAPWDPELPLLPVTGNYLDQTREVVRRAQAQLGITGPDADGTVIGPRTKAAFARFAAPGFPNGARW
jgi:peptidoglycan hydrolase-like protein with peptidoglycan-binding domain